MKPERQVIARQAAQLASDADIPRPLVRELLLSCFGFREAAEALRSNYVVPTVHTPMTSHESPTQQARTGFRRSQDELCGDVVMGARHRVVNVFAWVRDSIFVLAHFLTGG